MEASLTEVCICLVGGEQSTTNIAITFKKYLGWQRKDWWIFLSLGDSLGCFTRLLLTELG